MAGQRIGYVRVSTFDQIRSDSWTARQLTELENPHYTFSGR
jgi:DNA invertase Pin-like site-specific DNA recombinase